MINLQTTLLARTYRNRHHDHLRKQIEHKQDKKQLLDFGSSERKPSQLSLLNFQAAIEGFAHYWIRCQRFGVAANAVGAPEDCRVSRCRDELCGV